MGREEEAKLRSIESPTRVFTGPDGEEYVFSLGILAECKPGAAGRNPCYLVGTFWLRLELTQMKADLREQASWRTRVPVSKHRGERQFQVLDLVLTSPPLEILSFMSHYTLFLSN